MSESVNNAGGQLSWKQIRADYRKKEDAKTVEDAIFKSMQKQREKNGINFDFTVESGSTYEEIGQAVKKYAQEADNKKLDDNKLQEFFEKENIIQNNNSDKIFAGKSFNMQKLLKTVDDKELTADKTLDEQPSEEASTQNTESNLPVNPQDQKNDQPVYNIHNEYHYGDKNNPTISGNTVASDSTAMEHNDSPFYTPEGTPTNNGRVFDGSSVPAAADTAATRNTVASDSTAVAHNDSSFYTPEGTPNTNNGRVFDGSSVPAAADTAATNASSGITNEEISAMVNTALEPEAASADTVNFEGNVQAAKTVPSGSTDGKDDGKISFGEGVASFADGVGKFFTNMVCDEKGNFSIGQTAKTVAVAGATVAAGAAAVALGVVSAPALAIGAGIVFGGMALWNAGKGLIKASNATTDKEAKEGWSEVGTGTTGAALAAVGVKAGLGARAASAGKTGAQVSVVSKGNWFSGLWSRAKGLFGGKPKPAVKPLNRFQAAMKKMQVKRNAASQVKPLNKLQVAMKKMKAQKDHSSQVRPFSRFQELRRNQKLKNEKVIGTEVKTPAQPPAPKPPADNKIKIEIKTKSETKPVDTPAPAETSSAGMIGPELKITNSQQAAEIIAKGNSATKSQTEALAEFRKSAGIEEIARAERIARGTPVDKNTTTTVKGNTKTVVKKKGDTTTTEIYNNKTGRLQIRREQQGSTTREVEYTAGGTLVNRKSTDKYNVEKWTENNGKKYTTLDYKTPEGEFTRSTVQEGETITQHLFGPDMNQISKTVRTPSGKEITRYEYASDGELSNTIVTKFDKFGNEIKPSTAPATNKYEQGVDRLLANNPYATPKFTEHMKRNIINRH